MNPLQKIKNLLPFPKRDLPVEKHDVAPVKWRKFTIPALLLITLAIPLTVFLVDQVQDFRQRAAELNLVQCTETSCTPWKSLGGVTEADPNVITNNNILFAFYHESSDHTLRYFTTSDGGTTYVGANPSGTGKIVGNPSATVWDSRVHVFVRGTDDGVWYKGITTTGTWSDWVRVPNPITPDQSYKINTDPAAITYKGFLFVFARGIDNEYWHNLYPANNNWSGWNKTGAGTTFTSAPRLSLADDKLYVEGTGTDGKVYSKSFTWNGSAWSSTSWSQAEAPNKIPSNKTTLGGKAFEFRKGVNATIEERHSLVATNPPQPASPTVTSVTVTASPVSMETSCPATIKSRGYITTNGPATVTYQWIRSDGATAPTQTITFTAAGTQAVTTSWQMGGNGNTYNNWQAIKIISPNPMESNKGNFTLTCRQAVGAQVTAVDVSASPLAIESKACPETITFTGAITTSGPATVAYQWQRNDGALSAVQNISFAAAGTQNVSTTWRLGSNTSSTFNPYNGWQSLKILSPNIAQSGQAKYKLTCLQPSIKITAPANNATYPEGTQPLLTVSAEAFHPAGISYVTFVGNGHGCWSVTSTTSTFTCTNGFRYVETGSVQIVATMYPKDGSAPIVSAPITISRSAVVPPDPNVITDTINVTCTSTGQLCTPMYKKTVTTGSVLKAKYTVSSGHCSSVRLHIYVDGVEKKVTPWLGWTTPTPASPFNSLPLNTGDIDLGPVSAGSHELWFQAEGQVGGCNSGKLATWGGPIVITTSQTPTATPTPTGQVCAAVMTPARNTTTGECKEFTSSCLPAGWVKDTSCSNPTPGGVTAKVSVSPASTTQACPAVITFTGTITSPTAGTITYKWLRSDNATAPTQSVVFTAAGTKTVTTTWTLGAGNNSSFNPFNGWEALQILTPNAYTSEQAKFSLTCTPTPTPSSTLKATTAVCSPSSVVPADNFPTVSMTLKDSSGTPLTGKSIQWTKATPSYDYTVGPVSTSTGTTTDSTGKSTAAVYISLNSSSPAFTDKITAKFPGDSTYATSSCTINVNYTPRITSTPTNTPTLAITTGPSDSPTPSATLTDSPTPTTISGTSLSLSVLLHGIGAAGDNQLPKPDGCQRTNGTLANPKACLSNQNPLHPERDVTVEILSSTNDEAKTVKGKIAYDNATGTFKGQVALPDVATGVYQIKILTSKYLKRQVSNFVTVTSGEETKVSELALVSSDVDEDNRLTILDYNIIIGCYTFPGMTPTCTGEKAARGDVNDDGKNDDFDENLFRRDLSVQPGQ